MLFDPGRSMSDLLGLVQRRICAAARDAYRGYLGRPLDSALYTARMARLPGLDPVRAVDTAVHGGSAERRHSVSLEQGVPLYQGVLLFRSIVGADQ